VIQGHESQTLREHGRTCTRTAASRLAKLLYFHACLQGRFGSQGGLL
jgi:hypothetical protein